MAKKCISVRTNMMIHFDWNEQIYPFACRKWYFGNIHTIKITSSVLKTGTFNLKMDELLNMPQLWDLCWFCVL